MVGMPGFWGKIFSQIFDPGLRGGFLGTDNTVPRFYGDGELQFCRSTGTGKFYSSTGAKKNGKSPGITKACIKQSMY